MTFIVYIKPGAISCTCSRTCFGTYSSKNLNFLILIWNYKTILQITIMSYVADTKDNFHLLTVYNGVLLFVQLCQHTQHMGKIYLQE